MTDLAEIRTSPMADGDLDVVLEDIRPGQATVATSVRADDYGALPGHGMTFASLLDLSLGAAVQSSLGPSQTYRVLEFRMSAQRPRDCLMGRVEAVARVVRSGPRVVSAAARVRDAQGLTWALGALVVIVD